MQDRQPPTISIVSWRRWIAGLRIISRRHPLRFMYGHEGTCKTQDGPAASVRRMSRVGLL